MSSQDEKTVERVAEAIRAVRTDAGRSVPPLYYGEAEAMARAALAAVPEQGGEDLRERERMLDSTRTCAECGDVEGFHVWPLDGSNSRAFRRNQCETFRPAASPAKGEGDAASTPPTGERPSERARQAYDQGVTDGLATAAEAHAAVQGEEDGSADARGLAYPIKLDDAYPCRGTDSNGKQVVWGDLLSEGDTTGPGDDDDCCPEARVVRGPDGLWVVWDPSVVRENFERVMAEAADHSNQNKEGEADA